MTMFARRRDELEREANRIGALAVRGDVTNAADLERLVERTVQAFGGIDIARLELGRPAAGPAAGDHRRRASRRRSSSCSCPPSGSSASASPTSSAAPAGRILCITSVAVKEPIAAPRPLEHDPARRHRLGEDARARARAATGSPSTASRRAGSTRRA